MKRTIIIDEARESKLIGDIFESVFIPNVFTPSCLHIQRASHRVKM